MQLTGFCPTRAIPPTGVILCTFLNWQKFEYETYVDMDQSDGSEQWFYPQRVGYGLLFTFILALNDLQPLTVALP